MLFVDPEQEVPYLGVIEQGLNLYAELTGNATPDRSEVDAFIAECEGM
jgi:hypothetical protein